MSPMLRLAILAPLALAACEPPAPKQPSARDDFDAYCVMCHGASAKGDGELAADLPRRPADLTAIAARNGGHFPMARIMSVIDGYTRGQHGQGPMPEFGDVLKGETVLYDAGDGHPVPTPARLIALAEYLRSIQQP